MKLYEIDQMISDVFEAAEIDEETGEIINLNETLLKVLEVEREKKIENLIGYWKNLDGDILKFIAEIDNLTKRKNSIENKQESIKRFLDYIHGGVGREYGVHKIGYRRSTILVGDNVSLLPEEFIQTEVIEKPLKNEIKKAINEGKVFDGWILEEKQNIQIK